MADPVEVLGKDLVKDLHMVLSQMPNPKYDKWPRRLICFADVIEFIRCDMLDEAVNLLGIYLKQMAVRHDHVDILGNVKHAIRRYQVKSVSRDTGQQTNR